MYPMTWATLLGIGTFAIAAIYCAVSQRVAIRRLARGGGRAPPVNTSPVSLTRELSVPLPRLVFPTVSLLPGTGRTHWLAMLHRELNAGSFPRHVDFGWINRGQDDFQSVEGMLLGHNTRSANAPWAQEVLVHDGDWLGRSHCCVALQEYRSDERLTSEDRPIFGSTSLGKCQGIFVFLDPTRVTETDRRHVVARLEECRDIHGDQPKRVGIPVAICVTKLDLLPSRIYSDEGSGHRVDDFFGGLADSGWGFDEPAIALRSKSMQDLCDLIWPGWEIEKVVSDVFGGRCIFFPLTPVGLNESGETDLSRRTISPLGILHPLMWLLHMNGFATLPQQMER